MGLPGMSLGIVGLLRIVTVSAAKCVQRVLDRVHVFIRPNICIRGGKIAWQPTLKYL